MKKKYHRRHDFVPERMSSDKTVADSIRSRFRKTDEVHVEEQVVKVGKRVNIIDTFVTASGKIVGRTMSPLMVKFEKKDVAQVFIGSLLFASPFMVTQEVWDLGAEIHTLNAIGIVLLSLLALVTLVYYTRYQKVRDLQGRIPKGEFVKRIFGTYIITLVIVGFLLATLERAPWLTDFDLSLKRTIIVSLPASLGGAVADLLK